MFPGNHDFWLGDFFPRELGIRVAAEREIWTLGNLRVLLTHGDGLDPDDHGYHLLKRLLRNQAAIFLFGMLHPEVAFWLARTVSGISRRSAKYKRTWINDRYLPFAQTMISQGISVVVAAHTHTAQVIDVAPGHFVNPGDWLRRRTYAILDASGAAVYTWPERRRLPVQPTGEITDPPLGGGKGHP